MATDDFKLLGDQMLSFAEIAIERDGFLLAGVLRRIPHNKDARAVAWCVDMRVVPPGTAEKTDALVLLCESSAGDACVVVMPYRSSAASTSRPRFPRSCRQSLRSRAGCSPRC